jgi:beta-galactosidase beta subunit
MKSIGNILLRILAVFAASGLSVIGAGAIAGVDTITAVTVAGLTAVAAVVEKLARGFMNDGKLDLDEINAAFASVDTKAKSEADLKVEAKQNGTDITIKANGATEFSSSTKPDGQVPEEHDVDEDWDKDDK